MRGDMALNSSVLPQFCSGRVWLVSGIVEKE